MSALALVEAPSTPEPDEAQPIASILGSCLDQTCGGSLQLGASGHRSSAVLRYGATCDVCSSTFVLTVTMRRATRRDVDPWSDHV